MKIINSTSKNLKEVDKDRDPKETEKKEDTKLKDRRVDKDSFQTETEIKEDTKLKDRRVDKDSVQTETEIKEDTKLKDNDSDPKETEKNNEDMRKKNLLDLHRKLNNDDGELKFKISSVKSVGENDKMAVDILVSAIYAKHYRKCHIWFSSGSKKYSLPMFVMLNAVSSMFGWVLAFIILLIVIVFHSFYFIIYGGWAQRY
ncbi:hypothetical protein L1987_01606 [Smallanthus sonchifolius]|uniref:Uncharacterized protein n=1 Tax=Smallanthus sonchifolius TaxID=185202 RepID=A0ACB9K5K7_9ASTR|nr:hypothetical protein L1987_01606 [Smallanthus sonchifolius]